MSEPEGFGRWPTRAVTVSDGQQAIVDEPDYDLVNAFTWYPKRSKKDRTTYAKAGGRGESVLMHRLILRAPGGVLVDHANGNGLDNRRVNLRLATPGQNFANSGPRRKKYPCPYKGVSLVGGKWRASICVNSRSLFLGYFDTPEQAAAVYDRAALVAWGPFARVNFPSPLDDRIRQAANTSCEN